MFLRQIGIFTTKHTRGNFIQSRLISARTFFTSSGSNSKAKETDESMENATVPEKSGDDSQQSEQISEYDSAIASLRKSEALSNELHRSLLFKYAEAENKRRERLEEIKRRDAKYIQSFAEKTLSIYGSLDKVCTLAQSKSQVDGSSEKVRSLAEGLVMTRDIMKNILSKHNVVSNK